MKYCVCVLCYALYDCMNREPENAIVCMILTQDIIHTPEGKFCCPVVSHMSRADVTTNCVCMYGSRMKDLLRRLRH
jgi:hypothetical protein